MSIRYTMADFCGSFAAQSGCFFDVHDLGALAASQPVAGLRIVPCDFPLNDLTEVQEIRVDIADTQRNTIALEEYYLRYHNDIITLRAYMAHLRATCPQEYYRLLCKALVQQDADAYVVTATLALLPADVSPTHYTAYIPAGVAVVQLERAETVLGYLCRRYAIQ
jgi:hypothetical protein